jgi:ferredoxin-NADP reductase
LREINKLKIKMNPPYIVKILKTGFVTHNVKNFTIEKPEDYEIKEGQAVEVRINKPEWNTKERPFTPTNTQEELVLEFTIKSYPEHNGVTKELHALGPGDELIIDKPFDTFEYKGPGIFIAGGTGITPFISIFRKLAKKSPEELEKNRLIFANKTHQDIIYERELTNLMGKNATFILSEESYYNYEKIKINKEYLQRQNLNKEGYFYICGPEEFTNSIVGILIDLGVNKNKIFR